MLSPKHDAMHLVPLGDAVDFADDQAARDDESQAACQRSTFRCSCPVTTWAARAAVDADKSA